MAGSFVNFVKNVERLGQKKRGRRPVFNAHQFYPSAIEADLERATREEFLRAWKKISSLRSGASRTTLTT